MPRRGSMLPSSTLSNVVFPDPDGPTMPAELLPADAETRRRSTRVRCRTRTSRRPGGSARRPSTLDGRCLIADTSRRRARRCRTSNGPQRRRVATERLGHRDEVESHQAEPRVLGIAGVPGRSSSRSSSTYSNARLAADLLEHRAREHLGPEDRRDAAGRDLIDQIGDLGRGRILEVGDLDRADDVPVVRLRRSRRRRRGRSAARASERSRTRCASPRRTRRSSPRTRRSWPRSSRR